MSSVIEVRSDPEGVDALWLTAVLRDSGVAGDATVTDVRVGDYIGTGQMGRNVRFHLSWDDPTDRPATLVGKFPTLDVMTRMTGFGNGSYRKEFVFYDDLQSTVEVRAPQPYATVWDDAVPDFVLLMEDLSGSEQGDQLAGLTVDQAALAVEQAVKLHAPRWGDDSLMQSLGQTTDDAVQLLTMVYAGTKVGTLDRLGANLDDEVIRLVDDLEPLIGRWAAGRSDTTRTLVHMDFRPDNFLFAATPDAPPMVVVDWQTMAYGAGTNDVAYAIGGGFEPAERAAVERELVEDYSARLAAAGVDYPVERCWRDYCESSVWGVVMSIIATMLAEETERGNEMLTTMLRRHARHALDLDALNLLRQDDR